MILCLIFSKIGDKPADVVYVCVGGVCVWKWVCVGVDRCVWDVGGVCGDVWGYVCVCLCWGGCVRVNVCLFTFFDIFVYFIYSLFFDLFLNNCDIL